MKKLVLILLGCFLLSISLFALTACNGGDENSNDPPHTHDYSIAEFDDKSHWFECECGKKSSVAFHNLINNACICGYQVTETHTHDYKTLKFDSISHWYECECGDKSNLENHKGGTATETSKPICSVCNSEYGSTLIHTHNFNKEVVNENYLKTPAKCESKAEYYYSCSCGEKGTNLFLHGDELGHKYSDFVSNGDGTHTKVCTNDNTHKIIKDCSGGTATCEKLAKCLDCKEEYGELSDHKYENGKCKWCEIKKPSEGLIYTLINNGTKYEVSSVGDCTDTDIVIPSIYNDKIVTSIGDSALYNCYKLTSVTIPDSVTSIGDSALYNCYKLTSVTIPDSVTSIGDGAFSSCDSLETIKVDGKNTKYKSIDGNLYSIDGKTLIQYAIGKTATSFLIPASVTSIGYSALRGCESLTSIEIPNSVTSIGERGFYDCYNLKTVTFGENSQLESIGDYAFYYCKSLTNVEIPDSVTSIGGSAFSDCYNLKTVTFGENSQLESIGSSAFYDCLSLTSIEIPASVTSIGYDAFDFCDSLRYNEKDGLKYLGNSNNKYLYLAGTVSGEITTAIIDFNCKFIGYSAFSNCSSLTSIEIPASVTSIGEWAFWNCESLESIKVDENNTKYKSIDGNLYSIDGKTLIQYAIGKSATSFLIPDSVTSIGSRAFYFCDSLTSIEIPNSVTSIGSSAFSSCRSLTSIEIPASVTSIGGWAFSSCDKLTDIYCEAESQPTGWDSSWLGYDCDATVHWGSKIN